MTQLFIVLPIMIIPVILVLAGMAYLFLLTKVVETNNKNNMNFPQGAWECSDFPIHEKRQHKHENRHNEQVDYCVNCGEELNNSESIICDWCREEVKE